MLLPQNSHLTQVLLRPHDVNVSSLHLSCMPNTFPVLSAEKVTFKESNIPSQLEGEQLYIFVRQAAPNTFFLSDLKIFSFFQSLVALFLSSRFKLLSSSIFLSFFLSFFIYLFIYSSLCLLSDLSYCFILSYTFLSFFLSFF